MMQNQWGLPFLDKAGSNYKTKTPLISWQLTANKAFNRGSLFESCVISRTFECRGSLVWTVADQFIYVLRFIVSELKMPWSCSPKQIMSTLCITGNTRISCAEFVCDKRKHNCKCLLIFVLPKTQKTKHFREGLRFVVRADLIYNYSTLFPLLRHLLDGLEMLSQQNTIRCFRLSR